MKRVLSLVLAFVLVLGMVPAVNFAVESDFIADLRQAGVVKGNEHGELNLGDTFTRAELAVILARMNNVEEEAKNYPGTNPFTDMEGHWAAKEAAYVAAQGWMVGPGDGTFNPTGEVTGNEVIVTSLVVLGYERPEWDTAAITLAGIEAGLTVANTGVVTREQAFRTQHTALFVVPNAEGVILAEKYNWVTPEVPVVTELKVNSVTADNLKQVYVEFNQDVEGNEEVAKAANYTVADAKVQSVSVEGHMVTLNLEKAVAQQAERKVEVSDKVLAEKFETTLTFFDTTIPQVVGMEAIGTNKIKVSFSEPMQQGANLQAKRDSFTLIDAEGRENFVRGYVANNEQTEFVVEFARALENGATYKLTAEKIKDFADYTLPKTTQEVTVVALTDAPQVIGHKEADQLSVTLVFDRDIVLEKDGEANFYHTNRNNPVNVKPTVNGNELKLTWATDKQLPDGLTNVYVAADSVIDHWGNKNDQLIRYSFEVAYDFNPPAIDKIEVKSQTLVEVHYTKGISKVGEYKLLNEEGKEIENVISNTTIQEKDNKVVEVTFGSKQRGNLTLVAKDVEDALGNKMAEVKFPFFVKDMEAPVVTGVTLYDNGKTGDDLVQTLVVKFDKEMATEGDFRVNDLAKYRFDDKELAGVRGITIRAIEGATAVEIRNATGAEKSIDFKTGANLLQIGRVQDASGNNTTWLAQTFKVDAPQDIAPVNTGARRVRATGKNTVVVEFDQALTAFDSADFMVYYMDGTKKETIHLGMRDEVTANKTKLTITLDKDLDANGQYDGKDILFGMARTDKKDVITSNAFGDKVFFATDILIYDAINPSIYANTDANRKDNKAPVLDAATLALTGTTTKAAFTVTLTTDENVKFAGSAGKDAMTLVKTDFVVQVNGKTVAAENIDVIVDGSNKIELVVTAEVKANDRITVSTIAAPRYITDSNENRLNEFKATTLRVEAPKAN